MDNSLIKRQDAIDIVDFECGEWRGLAKTIEQAIERLPSAQPEIIYCEECKYCKRENAYYLLPDGTRHEILDKYVYCTRGREQFDVRLDDFCSWAERRTDD